MLGSRYEHFHRAVQIGARFGATTPWNAMARAFNGLNSVRDALDAVESRSAVKAVLQVDA